MILMFDNQCPPNLAAGLNIIEAGNRRSATHAEVKHIRDYLPENATDEEIIKCAGENKAIIITFDKDFKHIKHYYTLYKLHKAGVVFFKSSKNTNYWEIVKTFINAWEEMKAKIIDDTPPFAYQMDKQGSSNLQF